jgi:ribosome biogenesis GTPase / thiamine phosphate phosphatase
MPGWYRSPVKSDPIVDGTVIRIDAGQSLVDTSEGVLRSVLRGRLSGDRPAGKGRGGRTDPAPEPVLAVGDRVRVAVIGDGSGVIEEVEPRRTKLSRRAVGPGKREQIVAANVDQLVIVSSLHSPAPSLNLVDRYLVAAEHGGLVVALCMNKVDLGIPPEIAADLEPYVALGYPVLWTSAVTGSGIADLRAQLTGRTSVLAGKSGVGKSALLKAVDPGLELRSAPISAATGKGRHTTSFSSLLPLAGGGYVVDTPGIREYTLWELVPEDLDQHFPEIAAAAAGCRFRNCAHQQEPDCAVKDAVAAGRIPARRFSSYGRIRSGLDEDAAD